MTTKQTPSAKIVQEASPERTVVDAKGRQITWKSLTILDQYKLACAMGAAHADNSVAMRIATIAAMVTEIDGIPNIRAHSPATVEASIARLGDEGVAAMMIAATREMQATEEEALAAAADPLATSKG